MCSSDLSDIPRNEPIRDELDWIHGFNIRVGRLKTVLNSAMPQIGEMVAEVIGDGGPPRVLGRLVSRGPAPPGSAADPGALLFRWEAALPLPAGTNLAAHIHTGSGDRGLPRGLWLGDALLPGGVGPFDLLISPAGPVPAAGEPLWVRRPQEASR